MMEVSGSSKQRINGTKQMTKPEYSIYPWDKRYDWCSNYGKSYDEHPYITYYLKSKKMKFNGYFVRCGCCYEGCCCDDENNGYCFDCCLYSWSLLISDDNKTWTEVHRVDKDNTMKFCNEKTYNLDKTYTAKYVKIIQNEHCPGFPPCISINKFELYGDIIHDDGMINEEEFVSFHDVDEDVSIIGHISRNSKI
ncbi:hypothetical protein TVAG_432330 [Trichomonas vaginalis G3]|uniref:F5/8 type C domain-containing protein n=1 Tax=Trichomonas vaginalis (strain ATCC PRA-98 / G3) TaxID=412133 RepID=A2F8U7_TRIV3|nr:hypothetical protein TVAGG3_0126720 [Trichomonas vaginalis G3]EAX98683.1 hypothetical protein TVAG_432330 [Trichomonas vaginalis G3]KAI5545814.1 hypothetical protein TVAGG3_0126720 [Trichomonas vaginalis G3]|eukprot:XP_001311613.1 hypothetical protein [Trichomonas vaginalis G3]